MKRFIYALGMSACFLIGSQSGFARTIANIECYTGGQNPRRVFDGVLAVDNIVDRDDGSFSVRGRKVLQRSVLDSSREDVCRRWYMKMKSWVYPDTNETFYTYERGTRNWNVIEIETEEATTRMSCSFGSIVTEYDSSDAYIAELARKYVEVTPPRPGQRENYETHVSGRTTVSSAECLFSAL